MDDLISRQAAIDAARDWYEGLICGSFKGLEKRLRALPPAQPKRGKWIDTGSNEEWYAREYSCSECGGTMLGDANFCPNCGAKMEVTT